MQQTDAKMQWWGKGGATRRFFTDATAPSDNEQLGEEESSYV